tara:strand:- start:73 stop:960 length:888 start_codon:yes stop_codon:yes gene_type:complete
MKKSKLRQLIKEVLTKKKSCSCGCNTCENVDNPGVVLNENLSTSSTISQDLQYHIDNKLPLTENTFRYGSKSFLNLWDEARTLYVREIVHVNDLDKEILEETNLGNYGVYEGVKVPLDMPMEESVNEAKLDQYTVLVWHKREKTWEGEDDMQLPPSFKSISQAKDYANKKHQEDKNYAWTVHDEKNNKNVFVVGNIDESVNEAKNDDKPLNKPKRGGAKAYYVYVKDPKTKKVKKVSFGSGGLKAKINNKEARKAFAARHKCSTKKDKTKAGYWSCNLPRYAKALGIKSSFSGYW